MVLKRWDVKAPGNLLPYLRPYLITGTILYRPLKGIELASKKVENFFKNSVNTA